ncbi:hypothetical protein Glove_707g119 [Diversispora epigaea]|uniref:Uncharacterized protein n=1 Tax=Diversispora epigaea TaxID=1348612 RepID=A0A397G1H4_9GLOM|nr:hypothetical protein Glove_707g119 [Diversispora epigaea]
MVKGWIRSEKISIPISNIFELEPQKNRLPQYLGKSYEHFLVLDKPEYELVLGDIWICRLMYRIREHIHPKPKLYMYTPEWYNARNNKEEKPIISLKKFYNLLFLDCTFDFQMPDNLKEYYDSSYSETETDSISSDSESEWFD